MASEENGGGERRGAPARVLSTDFPRNTLEDILRIPKAIWDFYAGDPVPPHDVAIALELSPTSSHWRVLTGSALGYGLTDGGYNADTISLTDLGRRVVAPTAVGADKEALRDAVLQPSIMRAFFEKYNRAQFPPDRIAANVLVGMGLPKDRTDEAVEILRANGSFVGIVRETKTGQFLSLDAAPGGVVKPAPGGAEDEAEENDSGAGNPEAPAEERAQQAPEPEVRERPSSIFIAHGKNSKPLDQLKRFLTTFGIAHRVTGDEPHGGRSISDKVRQTMLQCGSAIVIFTKDEEFFDKDGNSVWRPSENVVHELGAALFAYEGRVVIFKEEGIKLPSNYSGIGYIEFAINDFEKTTTDLLKELVNLKLVRITPA